MDICGKGKYYKSIYAFIRLISYAFNVKKQEKKGKKRIICNIMYLYTL